MQRWRPIQHGVEAAFDSLSEELNACRRLPQIHIPPHALAAVPRCKPQIQSVLTAGHGVAGPAVGGGPLGAVLRAVDPPSACAWVVGGVDCAAVGVELLGGAAVVGKGAGGEGGFYGCGVEGLPILCQRHGWKAGEYQDHLPHRIRLWLAWTPASV